MNELTDDRLRVRQRAPCLKTKKKVRVADRLELRRYGLIYVEVHQVENFGGEPFETYEPANQEIAWFDINRLQEQEDEIPPHIFEAARFALIGEPEKLRYWDRLAPGT